MDACNAHIHLGLQRKHRRKNTGHNIAEITYIQYISLDIFE